MSIDISLLSALPFPQSIKEHIMQANRWYLSLVSDETFLVRDAKCSQEHQASNVQLSAEFSHFLSKEHVNGMTLLSK